MSEVRSTDPSLADTARDVRDAWECDDVHIVHERDLVALTIYIDEHPEWWDGPCMCGECREYADE